MYTKTFIDDNIPDDMISSFYKTQKLLWNCFNRKSRKSIDPIILALFVVKINLLKNEEKKTKNVCQKSNKAQMELFVISTRIIL